jgi:two-component system chemotaxis response regulator CheY
MKTILIVDDDADLRTMMRRVLEGEGYRVREAEDGFVGIDLIDELEPDLVLLDVSMPLMSGSDVLASLARRKGGRVPKVITMSGRRSAVSPTKCFLLKPVSATLLTAVVRDFCGGPGTPIPGAERATPRHV